MLNKTLFDDLLKICKENNFFLPSPLAHYGAPLQPYLENKSAHFGRFYLSPANRVFDGQKFSAQLQCQINSLTSTNLIEIEKLGKKIINKINKNYLSSIASPDALLVHLKISAHHLSQDSLNIGTLIRMEQKKAETHANNCGNSEAAKTIANLANAKINLLFSIEQKIRKKYARSIYAQAAQQSPMYKFLVAYILSTQGFSINYDQFNGINLRNKYLLKEKAKTYSAQELLDCLCNPVFALIAMSDEITELHSKPLIKSSYKEHISNLAQALDCGNLSAIKDSFSQDYFIEKGIKGPNLHNIENVLVTAQMNLFERQALIDSQVKINPLPIFLLSCSEGDNTFFAKALNAIEAALPNTYKQIDYTLGLTSAQNLKPLLEVNYAKTFNYLLNSFEAPAQKESLEKEISKPDLSLPVNSLKLPTKI